jgi:hypothetical protein
MGIQSDLISLAQAIEKATDESRSTIKARLKQLTGDRLLVRYGKGRSTRYGLYNL